MVLDSTQVVSHKHTISRSISFVVEIKETFLCAHIRGAYNFGNPCIIVIIESGDQVYHIDSELVTTAIAIIESGDQFYHGDVELITAVNSYHRIL